MDSLHYFLIVYENWFLFLLANVVVFIIYYFVFRRYYISILDPFTYATFFSAMAVVVPLFLFFVDQISLKLFLSFLFTQTAFFLGFLTVSPIKIHKKENYEPLVISGQEIRFAKWLFIIIGITDISLQLFSYKLVGIPILADSRLAIYGESGGIENLLKRALDVIFQCYVFLAIFFFYYKNKSFGFKIFTWISIVAVVIFSMLSGAKGALVTFGNAIFIYALYSLRWGDNNLFFKIKKLVYKFGIIGVLAAIGIIAVSEKDTNPFVFLLYRIGQSGDVYYMAYPNAVIDKVPTMNWFVALFASPLSLLGLIPRSMVPKPIGFFLMEFHNPGIEFKGPNPRMNIFSYVYFGVFFSPLFCFVIGVITSFFRNKIFYLLPKNIFGCFMYFLFLNFALTLEPDFYNAQSAFINILIILPFFIIVSYFLSLKKDESK
ncbi:O-antigen polymerase [Mucilaginibacter aquaedulcis]|uniref:O-antigen polymerase n=1 Tax=Mucilaginibacter aquaedulcis TaxID=1187081 RepID=UPI0025B4D935|nr:O-antigen polymerase [Mucilaginibacter aquaedulcis]MDN3547638.1 O-antigen polymerase [Mucilaginibacter aquaedulcis]